MQGGRLRGLTSISICGRKSPSAIVKPEWPTTRNSIASATSHRRDRMRRRCGLGYAPARFVLSRACPQLVWRLWNLAAGGSNPNRKENGSESDEERGSVMPVRRDWGFTNHRLSDSWEVGLRRADLWSALDYAMTNGIGSRIFCPAVRAT